MNMILHRNLKMMTQLIHTSVPLDLSIASLSPFQGEFHALKNASFIKHAWCSLAELMLDRPIFPVPRDHA